MKFLVFAFALLGLATIGCQNGSVMAPTLTKLKQPTFNGQTSTTISITSLPTTITGNCDPLSTTLQVSQDNINWSQTKNCTSTGYFSVSWAHQPDFYIRAGTPTSYTPSALATLSVVTPPSSPLFTFVSSGQAAQENTSGSQNAMGTNFEVTSTANGTYNLRSQVPGMIYEP